MEQHLGRQSGVQKVQVSLIDGKVDITPKEDGLIDPMQLMKATYDSGVTVAEMNLIARGQITKSGEGGIALQVQKNLSFPIAKNDRSQELESMADSGKWVTVAGLLYRKTEGQKKQTIPDSFTITIQEIQQKE